MLCAEVLCFSWGAWGWGEGWLKSWLHVCCPPGHWHMSRSCSMNGDFPENRAQTANPNELVIWHFPRARRYDGASAESETNKGRGATLLNCLGLKPQAWAGILAFLGGLQGAMRKKRDLLLHPFPHF